MGVNSLPKVLFDKTAAVYFIWKIYLYYIIGNGQPREPAQCQLYRHTFVPYISTSETGYDVVAVEGGAENASTGKRKYGKSKYESAGMENVDIVSGWEGATENARHEFAAPDCKGGKCETRKCGTKLQGWKMREKLVWKAKVWKSVSK